MAEGVVETNTEGAAPTAPSAPTGSGLDLIGLTKVFPGGTVAVDDVNLHVDHGEYVVLLGPSGCGKTTTLRMIGGHEYPTEGDIVLDGAVARRPAAAQAADDDRLPALRAVPAPERPRQRRVRAEDGGHGQVGAARAGRWRRSRWSGSPSSPDRKPARAVRRPAAARRARARARDQAQGAAPRRAARRPRPPAPAAHARRAAEPPAPARADVHPRHAQPGRGAVDGRPDRGHERRPHPAGRRPADDRHEAGDRARRPVHGRQQHHPRQGDVERDGNRLVDRGRARHVRASVRSEEGAARRSARGARLGAGGRGRDRRAAQAPPARGR